MLCHILRISALSAVTRFLRLTHHQRSANHHGRSAVRVPSAALGPACLFGPLSCSWLAAPSPVESPGLVVHVHGRGPAPRRRRRTRGALGPAAAVGGGRHCCHRRGWGDGARPLAPTVTASRRRRRAGRSHRSPTAGVLGDRGGLGEARVAVLVGVLDIPHMSSREGPARSASYPTTRELIRRQQWQHDEEEEEGRPCGP